ncbi:TetR/AcrR family transcriptional regulator [Endozoicomonas atrinae]|uniref:TetR/AcrR family transcriptional regulator n=1 Tax=Endozoicomonas atrinae TaxID=1333660 RepID=UPI0009F21DE1|nr:TetR/AcrR family transcriptional regulator [Endozoicomonas atrinae]
MTEVITDKKMTKGERTAQRILDVSERLFAQKGYAGASLREVAEEVGIREPGLYRHFKNKEELYQQVLERALRPLADTMDNMLSIDEIDRSQIQLLPAVMFRLLSRSPHVVVLLQRALSTDNAIQSESSGSVWLDQWLSSLVTRGQQLFRHLQIRKNATDVEVALMIVNWFNLCLGYFTSAKLFEQISGKDAFSEPCLNLQTELLQKISQVILSDFV